MTIPTRSPWPAPPAATAAERLDTSPDGLAELHQSIMRAARRGQLRGCWKFQARRAVADGIAARLIQRQPGP